MEWRHTVWTEAKVVYSAVPKVANTSIKSALLRSLVDPALKTANPHDAELPYTTVEPSAIGSRYPGFLHFAVIRDPYDRMVSFYGDKIIGEGMNDGLKARGFRADMPFDEVVGRASELPDEETDPHLRSQSFLLVNEKGRARPDVLLRFERLEHDWGLLQRLVASATGTELPDLPHRRVSERAEAASYYDDATRAVVRERYRTDFEVLGYDTPAAEHTPIGDLAASVDKLLAERPGSVLDVTGWSDDVYETCRRHGVHYLGRSGDGETGQLARPSAVEHHRVNAGVFAVAIVDPTAASHRPLHERIAREFVASARPVVDPGGRPLGDG